MTLHLVELPLSLRALHVWAGARRLGGGFDEGVALHHLLGETFGPAMLQPFRLMVAPGAESGNLYAYAAEDAATLRRKAQLSLIPDLAAVVELGRLRSIPRPVTTWAAGQRIGFDLRIRPVVRLASALAGRDETGAEVGFRKGAEVDAFLAAVLRGATTTREDAYRDWLQARLGPAADLEIATTRMVSFQRSRIQRDGKRLEGPDAVLHGTVTIADPAAFAALLARGVGRHRSYGYGMLLLRPAQRAT